MSVDQYLDHSRRATDDRQIYFAHRIQYLKPPSLIVVGADDRHKESDNDAQ